MQTFSDWYDKATADQNNENNIFPPAMKPEEAITLLCDYLLGEDWYVVDPLSYEQCITCMVAEILSKYSKKFRKELKTREKS